MRSDIKDYLYNICNKENIRVVWLENLSPYTPPSASFEHRCIVMNLTGTISLNSRFN